jgi:hypothetical protein
MIEGLDSSQPPTPAQVAQAAAGGVKVWSGYLQTRPNVGLFRAWSEQEFGPVKALPGTPLAFCSGWDDPAALAALAASWGVRLCLDVEAGIRDDGPWVDGFLAASGAGLYGLQSVHYHPAPFHVLGAYPTSGDPAGDTWQLSKGGAPAEPHGWQWAGTHGEFGISVDSTWFDDWFAPAGGDDMYDDNDRSVAARILGLVSQGHQVDASGAAIPDAPRWVPKIAEDIRNAQDTDNNAIVVQLAAIKTGLDAIQARLASLPAGGGTETGIFTETITPQPLPGPAPLAAPLPPELAAGRPAAPAAPALGPGRTYTVKLGDTLASIAAGYPPGRDWRPLYDLNVSVIGANPDVIYPGQVLAIPADW